MHHAHLVADTTVGRGHLPGTHAAGTVAQIHLHPLVAGGKQGNDFAFEPGQLLA